MIMRKPTALLIAGMLMLMFAAPALAQPGHRMGPGQGMTGQGPGRTGMAAQLTPQQQQTLQKIQAAHQNAFADITRKLWAKQIQLQAALTEDKIDDGKIRSLTSDINTLRSSLFDEQVKMQVELSRAGLAFYTMRGGMMGQGMGAGMMGGIGFCPMMGSGMMGPDGTGAGAGSGQAR